MRQRAATEAGLWLLVGGQVWALMHLCPRMAGCCPSSTWRSRHCCSSATTPAPAGARAGTAWCRMGSGERLAWDQSPQLPQQKLVSRFLSSNCLIPVGACVLVTPQYLGLLGNAAPLLGTSEEFSLARLGERKFYPVCLGLPCHNCLMATCLLLTLVARVSGTWTTSGWTFLGTRSGHLFVSLGNWLCTAPSEHMLRTLPLPYLLPVMLA